MSPIPKRKETDYFAEAILRNSNKKYDLFLFIEDEKIPYVYEELIARMYAENVKIGKVFKLKAKDKVIEVFKKWEQNKKKSNNFLFIVDKDFDYWKGKESIIHNHFLELTRYTIENFYIDKNSAEYLIKINKPELNNEDIIKLLNWDNWLKMICENLQDLFVSYVIVNKYNLSIENCSINPGRYLCNESEYIVKNEIDKYVKNVQEILKISQEQYDIEYKEIISYYKNTGQIDYHSLIKGKYLFKAMLIHVSKIVEKKLKEDPLIISLIVNKLDINNFNFLKDRIELILER